MTPLELAKAINAMGENELIQFNHKAREGGCNAELIREKVDELAKYVTVNPVVFGEAVTRTSIFETSDYAVCEEMYRAKTKPRSPLVEILFRRYPQFRAHYSILESSGIIRKRDSGHLQWTLTKISLAQYFEHLEKKNQRRRWSIIEKIFLEKNLRQYLYNHNETQRAKPSPDFEKVKELLYL